MLKYSLFLILFSSLLFNAGNAANTTNLVGINPNSGPFEVCLDLSILFLNNLSPQHFSILPDSSPLGLLDEA